MWERDREGVENTLVHRLGWAREQAATLMREHAYRLRAVWLESMRGSAVHATPIIVTIGPLVVAATALGLALFPPGPPFADSLLFTLFVVVLAAGVTVVGIGGAMACHFGFVRPSLSEAALLRERLAIEAKEGPRTPDGG